MPTVIVTTGGTPPLSNPGDTSAFLQCLIEQAGLPKDLTWEARVEKKGQARSDSPPVRVTGFKQRDIFLRVKPALHATVDHYVRLRIPDNSGYTTEEVYRQLRSQVKATHRYLCSQETTPQPLEPAMNSDVLTAPTTPLAPESASPESVGTAAPAFPDDSPFNLSFDTLSGVTRHPEKLRYVLTFVDQVSKTVPGSAMAFKKALRRACGWDDQPIRAVALVLAWLCKHDYVTKIFDKNDQVINYRLLPRGAALAFVGLGAASGTLPESGPSGGEGQHPGGFLLPDVEPGTLLIRFREKAQELADAGQRLEANRQRYRELQDELKRLDEEYNDIARVLVANREASALLIRLLDLQGSAARRP